MSGDAGDGEKHLCSQLLDRAWLRVDRKINAIVAPISIQLEMLIQSVREINERSSTRSTEENVTSDRSRSSGQGLESGVDH